MEITSYINFRTLRTFNVYWPKYTSLAKVYMAAQLSHPEYLALQILTMCSGGRLVSGFGSVTMSVSRCSTR